MARSKRLFSISARMCLLAFLSWHGAVFAQSPPSSDGLAALERGLRPTVLPANAPLPHWTLDERMRHHKVPGIAIALIREGKVVQARGYGVRTAGGNESVDADTLFSVGSISKVVAAATTLRLVDAGRLQLDRDVSGDLRRWEVPDVAGREGAISLRMLMSHTSGLNVHGFADYRPAEPIPTLVQVLEGKPPAKNEPVTRRFPPGDRNDYSGGAVTVEQLVIEDVVGKPFARVADEQVLAPLHMQRSTFDSPLPASRGNIAHAHDEAGAPAAFPRGWESFAEAGASGFWTTANDLGAFVGALLRSYRGQDDFLAQPTAVQMLTPVARSWFGLGPRLDGEGVSRTFHHGGANDSYRAWIEGYPETGEGFVILTNGANGDALAREIRNALTDALGHDNNALLRTQSDAQPTPADLAGHYVLDERVPMEVRGALADVLDAESFDMLVDDRGLQLRLPESTPSSTLQPVAPGRYTTGSGALRFLFHRDPHGYVRSVSVLHPASDSRAYYRRQ